MIRSSAKLFAAALITAPSMAFAVTLPAGLEVGDQYRIAFVTSESFLTDATSINIADYNAVAAAAANSQPGLAALNTDWFAIVSVPESSNGAGDGISAKTNTGTDDSPVGDTGVPIYRTDGVKLVDHYDDLWDRSIDVPLNVTEGGTPYVVPQGGLQVAWSGTTAEGEINTTQPLGGSGFVTGRGEIGATGDLWIATFGGNEGDSASIYVVSDVITVVPEPASLALLGLGGLLVLSRRRSS